MGMDSLEIILEIEETFGIKLPDEQAHKIVTVGDLRDYVIANLPPDWKLKGSAERSAKACLSAATFYELRRELVSILGSQRCEIRPTTSLETIFPLATRRKRWSSWARSSQLKCPALKRHLDVMLSLTAITLALTFVVNVYLLGIGDDLFSLFLTAVSCISIGLIVHRLSIPLATNFEGGLRTMGDLTKDILRRNYIELRSRHGFLCSDDVFEIIRGVLVAQLAVAPELVVPEASIVKDLGME